MRVIDPARALIEHNRMELGRDAHSVKSLSRHTLEQMVTRSSEGILLADAQDPRLPIVYANPAYEDLSGYTVEELTGCGWPLVQRNDDGQPELERLKAAIGRSEPCQVTLPDLRKDGTSWLSEVSVEPLHNARGELKYFLCIQKPAVAGTDRDVHGEPADQQPNVEVSLLQRELGRARQKIASLNRIDLSTGLLHFGHFQETLRRDLAIARREGRFISVLLFEIVEFDAYRQTFGAKAADSCQRMIGAQIARTLRRAGDLCARYDDSTLIAAVVGQTPEEAQRLADQVAENVRRLGLHNPRAKQDRYIRILSAVAGCLPGTGDDAETVIERAQVELLSRRTDTGGARAASP
jgi:diguanylate cyclase (GGDEF)-like protein/PAS domain S-box-containing protein